MMVYSIQQRAIFSCLLAAILWGLFWYPLRVLESLGSSGIWATIGIYSCALLAIMLVYGRSLLACGDWRSMFLLGLFAGWTNLAFIFAMLEGTVLRGLLFFYLSPLWTILLGRIILKESIKNPDYINLILGLSGAVILLSNDQMDFFSLDRADWFAISAGLAFSLNNICIRKTGEVPIQQKMFSAWLGVIVFSCAAIISGHGGNFTPSILFFFIAAAVGLFGMTLMTFSAQFGVTHIPVKRSAIIFLFEIPVGAVSAALWEGELPGMHEWVGGILIVFAAFLSAQTSIKESSTS